MTEPQPFSAWAGSRSPQIVLVGEAHGAGEDQSRQPFAGESGKELWRMMGEAWPDIDPAEHQRVAELHRYDLAWIRHRNGWLTSASCAMTNVFNLRPPGNRIDQFCCRRAETGPGYPPLPPLARGQYVRSEYLPELARLYSELAAARPNLIVALGNTACWALLSATNIGSIRGTISAAVPAPIAGMKVLPAYHPAAILRQWQWRVLTVADLAKARREAASPDISRPSRRILHSPTLAEAETWIAETLSAPPSLLAVDTETSLGLIDTIGFARTPDDALVIPFGPHRQSIGKGYSTVWPLRDGLRRTHYWTEPEEVRAWQLVRDLLESPIPKLFQNGLYDLQYILKLGIRPRNCEADTMLLHHSLYPEMQKGLGFLGSVYTNEPAWKLMRRHGADTEKRDE